MTPDTDAAAPQADTVQAASRHRRLLMGAVAGTAALAGVGLAVWRGADPVRAASNAGNAGKAGNAGNADRDGLAALWALRVAQPQGGDLDLASLRGKPLLINFWATWCAPCLREMPELDRFYREFSPRGWQVLGLAIDGPTPVREFLARVKIGFPIGLHLEARWTILSLWPGAAAVAVAGAFLIARRQALQDHDSFWSPPTRRITQALLPPLTAGLCVSMVCKMIGFEMLLPFIWALFYGCALHSAGFFMPRGVKLLGWIYIGLASGILGYFAFSETDLKINVHWLMGFFFGVLHLAYGIYLYFTEQKNPVA